MSLSNAADEYFGSINSMANRMYQDMQATKSAYENLWESISETDQKQILSESIIKPEVSVKYSNVEREDSEEYAVKFIMDDHCTYRDEHSGPFSFKSASQIDFAVFSQGPAVKKTQKKTKPQQKKKPAEARSETFMGAVASPNSSKDNDNADTNTLPKTGLDFLDNW